MPGEAGWISYGSRDLQAGVDAYDKISGDGAVAQWIEHRFPKCAVALALTLLDWSSVTRTEVTKAQS
jgi:hypothetical protein